MLATFKTAQEHFRKYETFPMRLNVCAIPTKYYFLGSMEADMLYFMFTTLSNL